jgi:hypothetical protein
MTDCRVYEWRDYTPVIGSTMGHWEMATYEDWEERGNTWEVVRTTVRYWVTEPTP